MSAVCPSCGVAVVPGYVRCPKCHGGLPLGRIKRTTVDPGGTALAQRKFPLSAVVVALGVALAMIVVFGVRGGSKKPGATAPPPAGPIEARPSGAPRSVAPVAPVAAPATEVVAADPRRAVAELEDALRRQRLWGRVEIKGPRVDVRSGSCSDPAMRPAIEARTTLLHDAGLTKLRCLEQSGAVVFERDL